MTPLERWNGLAWVCTTWLWKGGMDLLGSVWNGYGKVLLVVEEKGVLGPQCSPKHNAFDSSLCGCDLTTSISSPRTSHGNICESAQTDDLPRQPSKKYSTRSRCFAQRSSRARGLIRGWIQTAWNGLQTALRTGLLQRHSPKKPINRVCPCEESTDEQSDISTTGQRQTAMGLQTTPETGC